MHLPRLGCYCLHSPILYNVTGTLSRRHFAFTFRTPTRRRPGFKVLVDEETDSVLGAHLVVGPHVEEIISRNSS
jgi:hypothetical protein